MIHPADAYVAHTFLGLDGPLGIVAEVAAFLLLIYHIAALVLLSESHLPLGTKTRWAASILLVPIVGATLYLHKHRAEHRARRDAPEPTVSR